MSLYPPSSTPQQPIAKPPIMSPFPSPFCNKSHKPPIIVSKFVNDRIFPKFKNFKPKKADNLAKIENRVEKQTKVERDGYVHRASANSSPLKNLAN